MASEGQGGCDPLRHSKACSMTAFGLRTTQLCIRILSISHSQRLWLDCVILHRANLTKQAGYTWLFVLYKRDMFSLLRNNAESRGWTTPLILDFNQGPLFCYNCIG